MKLTTYSFSLPFRHPFTISKGTKTHQPICIVKLEQDGYVGYGEAPAISYYNITVDAMRQEMAAISDYLAKFTLSTPESFYQELEMLLPHSSFSRCALDMAAHDWYANKKGVPLWKSLCLTWKEPILTDFTIGMDTIEIMFSKIDEQPWPIYKVKLGNDNDLEIITAIRNHTTSKIRVDANAAWTFEKAKNLLPELRKLGIELVEQPLAKTNYKEMVKLKSLSPIPLMADESCVSEIDVELCAASFHGINIKLTKCGGITPAIRMIKRARELNLKVMIGSMNESTIGTAAVAHLLPLLDFVDMDGPLLLAEDLAKGITFVNGKAKISNRPGLGVEIIENKFAQPHHE